MGPPGLHPRPAAATRAFYLALSLATLLVLTSLWQPRFLPMQDYPQHLFIVAASTTFDSPTHNWDEHYELNWRLGPYSLSYMLLAGAALLVGAETSGRILLSVAVLLLALFVIRLAKQRPAESPPWPALLLLPLFFHQMFYYGFVALDVSLIVLLFALVDCERFATAPLSWKSALTTCFWLALLFLGHPYVLLVFIVLAGIMGAVRLHSSRDAVAGLAPPALMLVGFVLWFALRSSTGAEAQWEVRWEEVPDVARFYLLPFLGMQPATNPDWATVAAWGVAALTIAHAWRRFGLQSRLLPQNWLMVLACFIGSFALPFWLVKGEQVAGSYFNLRLVPVVYLLAVVGLSRIRMPGRAPVLMVGAVLVMLASTADRHARLSRETETVLPVLSVMKPGARVLPLCFESKSTALDPDFFYQFHVYDSYYYHVIVGGGANPGGFPNDLVPVRQRADVSLPAPETPWAFNWFEHGSAYDYVLARQPPAAFVDYMTRFARVVVHTEEWALFARGTK